MRASALAVGTLWLAGTCFAQPFPGCEARPEVHKELKQELSYQALGKLTWVDRVAREYDVLNGLIARYPRELEPHRQLIDFVHYETDDYPVLQSHYREQARAHPDDPLALYLAGIVLNHTDTSESIRLLEEARAKAPGFAWPNLELARTYLGGAHMDKKKAAERLNAFLAVCTASVDPIAQRLLGKLGDPALQTRVAGELRARLAKETEPERLQQYETLWGLEFRTHAPQEHAALRQQAAQDLKRLEKINPEPDVDWIEFLKRAYKETGAPEKSITALDDRLLREFPSSEFTIRILYERFQKAHKEPEDPGHAKAWAEWQQAYKQAVKGWIHDYPENLALAHEGWFGALNNDDTISEAEGIAALDHYLKAVAVYDRPASWPYLRAAGFLMDHKWQPARALELLQKAYPLFQKEMERDARDDNRTAQEQQEMEKAAISDRQDYAGRFLRAVQMANRPEAVQPLRNWIEGPVPTAKDLVSDYWLNRARLAVLEEHKTDGLAFYLLALQTRLSPPRPWHGKLEDHLSEEARALWKEMGGTEVAWAAWNNAPARVEEATEARWEKPTKQLPAFELADLSGKTWKLTTLEGKALLINIWATWCGPCNAELPHLQRLYESVKDRKDFQILTFNVDEDLGQVEPFMKEKGYTFPVLPAYYLVRNQMDTVGIPQNWIVDPHGVWRWTQIGYGGEPDWQKLMIDRLDSVRKPEGAPTSE